MEKEASNQTPEEATTVGMFLKFTRQSQKKSVETVSKDLCIRKIYIKAIEESDTTELAPVPYGIGFVRSYAEYLGLNADRVVQCYKEEHLPKKKDECAKKIVTKHTPLMIPNRRQILIGLSVLALLYVIWLVVSCKLEAENSEPVLPVEETIVFQEPDQDFDNLAEERDNVSETQSDISKQEASEQNAPSVDQVKIVESSYEENAGDLQNANAKDDLDTRVVVKFKGPSWFEIKDGKKVYISGIFQKGFSYEVPNVPGIIFSVGRYYNVDVFIDGKLTQVARKNKQTNIKLDQFLNH